MIKDLHFLAVRAKKFFQPTASKKRIGFVRPRFPLYSRAMPSTRIRVYDPVVWFADNSQFVVELFSSRKKYDAVIFQKCFDAEALSLAKQLREQGTIVILDMNVNYYDAGSSYIEEEQREQVRQFTEFSDYVVAASKYLKQVIEKQFPKKTVVLIEEAIPEKYFQSTVTPQNPPKTFLWVGFKWKVKELEVLKDTLSLLASNYGIGLRTIGGTEVDVGDMPVNVQQYREWSVHKKMRAGDVFIAPRDLTDPYNLAHTFTKIGGAMAMGIPVVASPVPSYVGSPAIMCATNDDWNQTLTAIAAGEYDLVDLGKRSTEYTQKHYHPDKIKRDYESLFNKTVFV